MVCCKPQSTSAAPDKDDQIQMIHSNICMMLMMVSTLCLININKGNVLIIYFYAETTVITLADWYHEVAPSVFPNQGNVDPYVKILPILLIFKRYLILPFNQGSKCNSCQWSWTISGWPRITSVSHHCQTGNPVCHSRDK